MVKKISIVNQALLVASAIWVWQVGRPAWKDFTRAFRNSRTHIHTPGYYFAGDANKTCAVITRPDPSKISHCEDGVHIAHKTLLITCDPGRPDWNPAMGIMTNSHNNGTLWIYDYGNDHSLQPVDLIGFPTNRTFHPLGLDVVPATANEPAYAFVVNLESKTGAVEVFTISDKAPYKAFYSRTLEHPLTHAPNAVVAVSPTQLYVSIDHRFTARMPIWKGIFSLVEDVLQAPLAWVTYIEILPDGTVNYSKAANFINFANGLFLSRDGREFAVASSVRAILSFYDRDPATSKLTFREKIALPHPPDNLRHDSEGNIVVSGSANLLHLMEFAAGVRTNSPSWITRITRRKPYPKGTVLPPDDMAAPFDKTSDRIAQNPKYEFTTMYYGDGTQFPSTSAAIIDGQELIGMSLMGRGILHCKPELYDA